MTRAVSRWHRRAATALGCVGVGLLLLGAMTPIAYAAGPLRVGWWNAASASGGPTGSSTAPSPTTPSGGIHVATGPTTAAGPLLPPQAPPNAQILAYGAVLYELPEGSSATLRLRISGSPQGTPQVAACPTANTSWPPGDDQPSSSEPAYDCGARHYVGALSADGTAMTFQVTAQSESTPGMLSLAIVPDPGSTALPTGGAPFAVDFAPPDTGSLTPEGSAGSSSLYPLPPPFLGSSLPIGPPGGAGLPLGVPSTSTPAPPPSTHRPVASAPLTRPAGVVPAETVRARIASALGIATLLAAVVLWSLGYGLLGGRIIPLSVPLKRE